MSKSLYTDFTEQDEYFGVLMKGGTDMDSPTGVYNEASGTMHYYTEEENVVPMQALAFITEQNKIIVNQQDDILKKQEKLINAMTIVIETQEKLIQREITMLDNMHLTSSAMKTATKEIKDLIKNTEAAIQCMKDITTNKD